MASAKFLIFAAASLCIATMNINVADAGVSIMPRFS